MHNAPEFLSSLRTLVHRTGVLWPSENDEKIRVVSRTKQQLAYYTRDSDADTDRIVKTLLENPDTDPKLKAVLALFEQETVISITKAYQGKKTTFLLLRRFGDLYVGLKTQLVQT